MVIWRWSPKSTTAADSGSNSRAHRRLQKPRSRRGPNRICSPFIETSLFQCRSNRQAAKCAWCSLSLLLLEFEFAVMSHDFDAIAGLEFADEELGGERI